MCEVGKPADEPTTDAPGGLQGEAPTPGEYCGLKVLEELRQGRDAADEQILARPSAIIWAMVMLPFISPLVGRASCIYANSFTQLPRQMT